MRRLLNVRPSSGARFLLGFLPLLALALTPLLRHLLSRVKHHEYPIVP